MIARRMLPLAFAGACASRAAIEGPAPEPGIDWAAAEAVPVTLAEYRFEPSTLSLRSRRPYRLVLTNRGDRAHDFTSAAFFRVAATRPGDAVGTAMRSAGGRIDVPAARTVELVVYPTVAGRYPLDCVKPLHATLGMDGEIVVT